MKPKKRLPEPKTALHLCPTCKVTKPFRDYYANPTSRTGYQYQCKECAKAAQQRRYLEMKEALAERRAKRSD